MMTQQPDRIRQYLKRRGCPPSVIKGGLDGLLRHWQSTVDAVAEGYDLTMDDYLNDMETRDVLAGVLEVASLDQRKAAEAVLERVDRRFRELTVECPPVLGEAAARENGHDPADQWWYYRRPRSPSPDFEEVLREAGLLA
jgi:hypothetical protein